MNLAAAIPAPVVESARAIAERDNETLVGFRPITTQDPQRTNGWVAKAWLVITDVGLYEFWPDGVCYRGAVLHSFDEVE